MRRRRSTMGGDVARDQDCLPGRGLDRQHPQRSVRAGLRGDVDGMIEAEVSNDVEIAHDRLAAPRLQCEIVEAAGAMGKRAGDPFGQRIGRTRAQPARFDSQNAVGA